MLSPRHRDAHPEEQHPEPGALHPVGQVLELVQDPARLADVTAAQLDLSVEEKFALLEDLDVASRLRKVLAHLRHRIEVHKVKEKIDSQVRAEFSKHQREAVLRQKLKAIQEELGETDEGDDLGELEERVDKAAMPPEAEKAAKKQVERLRQMPPQSAEYTDRKSTRLNSSHIQKSRMPSSA